MKRSSLFAVCLFVILLVSGAAAQTPAPTGQNPGNKRQARERMKQMDTNQDGQISREEWKGNPQIFDKVDKNNDGQLSQREAMKAGRAGREKLKQMDANHDGQIVREEWKGNPEAFARFDTNNDGILSKEELKQRRRNN